MNMGPARSTKPMGQLPNIFDWIAANADRDQRERMNRMAMQENQMEAQRNREAQQNLQQQYLQRTEMGSLQVTARQLILEGIMPKPGEMDTIAGLQSFVTRGAEEFAKREEGRARNAAKNLEFYDTQIADQETRAEAYTEEAHKRWSDLADAAAANTIATDIDSLNKKTKTDFNKLPGTTREKLVGMLSKKGLPEKEKQFINSAIIRYDDAFKSTYLGASSADRVYNYGMAAIERNKQNLASQAANMRNSKYGQMAYGGFYTLPKPGPATDPAIDGRTSALRKRLTEGFGTPPAKEGQKQGGAAAPPPPPPPPQPTPSAAVGPSVYDVGILPWIGQQIPKVLEPVNEALTSLAETRRQYPSALADVLWRGRTPGVEYQGEPGMDRALISSLQGLKPPPTQASQQPTQKVGPGDILRGIQGLPYTTPEDWAARGLQRFPVYQPELGYLSTDAMPGVRASIPPTVLSPVRVPQVQDQTLMNMYPVTTPEDWARIMLQLTPLR